MTMAESLRNEGRIEGKTEGKIEGKIEGKLEKAQEIATRLLHSGIDESFIMKITELSFNEIEKLKNKKPND